jgi:hypothetical protein
MVKIIEARKATIGKEEAKQIIKFENDSNYYILNLDYNKDRKKYIASIFPCELQEGGNVIILITRGSFLTIKENIKRYSQKEYLELVNQVFKFDLNVEANQFINGLYSKLELKKVA